MVKCFGTDYSGKNKLTSVVIPESVTSIGNYAFRYSTSLVSVTLPSGLTSIPEYIFSGCTSLTTVNIPDTVTSTDAIAGLERIVITGNVTGTINVSDKNEETEMTVVAVAADGTEIGVTATSMGTYTLEGLEAGDYTLTISGGKYAPRSYEITVDAGIIALDVELNPYGDINGDGKVTTADVGLANSHAKGVTILEGYQFVCADVKIDGDVTTADVGLINSHAKAVKTLW